ncbi:helix-turn-helix transcriptional regulator [Herbiconiux sp. KACC 21604]|uniref:response regulator transcription factor n=1 Tax=unclassified Herbiconiux TaxID=2618217 RepID=UPI001490C427|nr:helix-turn-helix transcriptional regulator [Herbiconiux sp. SALV-R1]QJU53429.1 helix-turn-helix transcriptional regulator [Herbiconiux sp. SALV-R1]WPO88396.1 helix-turn-helix transcriptional regulator [Herbiconiux sp. KACC 21604]
MTGSAGGGGAGAQTELDDLVDRSAWDEVVAALDERWAELLSDDPNAVKRAVSALPAPVLEAHPRWALAANYVSRYVSNGQTPTTIFRGTSPTPEPQSLLDVLAQLTSKVAERRARGRYTEATAAAAEARLLVDEADDDTRATLQQALPEIVFQWAMAWEYDGDTDRATREYTESYDAAVAVEHTIAIASTAGALAWIHALAGRNIQARNWLDRLPDVGSEWWENRASVTARFARVHLLLDELRLDDARRELAAVDLTGVPERWPAQKYLAALVEDDPARCLVLLTQIDSSAATLPHQATTTGAWAPLVAIARSVLLGRLDNWAASREALESLDIDGRGADDFGARQIRLWRAAALLVAGDAAQARRRATALVGISTTSPRLLIGALGVAAVAAHRLGDPESAAKQLRMAIKLANQHRLYLSLTVVPIDDLTELLEQTDARLPETVFSALSADVAGPGADPFLELTPRELAVVRSVIGSASLDDAAAELFVSRNTVKTQLRNAYRKLGVTSKAALEELAVRHGYTPEGD